jgi:branched-chain amino acid transport system substrate-binding protein
MMAQLNKKSLGTILLAVVIGLLLSLPAWAADTVKIGVMYSLTGPGSSIGTLQEEGAKLAIKDINERGGITLGGKKVKVEGVFRDDETKPQVAIQRLYEMGKDQGVMLLVGSTFGNINMALNNEIKKSGHFYISTNGVPEPFFLKANKAPYALNMTATSEAAGAGAAIFMAKKLNARKIACFMPDYVIGKTTFTGFEQAAKTLPNLKYQVFWVPVNTADMTPYFIKVKEYAPDMVFIGSWANDAISALKTFSEMGLGKNMKAMHFWLMNVFATGIPPEAMEGIYGQMWWYWDMAGFKDSEVVKTSKAFSERYVKAYNAPPDPYAMNAYYGVMETVRGVELAGSTEPEKVFNALMQKPDFVTAKGPARWRKDGRAIYKYDTFMIKGKGSAARKGTFKNFDYAQIVDAFGGMEFIPTLESEGY